MTNSIDKPQEIDSTEMEDTEATETVETHLVARYPLANIKETVTKQELAQYPSEGYDGKIIVVQSELEAKKASAYLLDIGRNDVLEIGRAHV